MSNAELAVSIVSVILIFGGATIISCMALWAWRSRGLTDGERAYQTLAEDATAAQRRTSFELGQIAEDVADMRARMLEMERLLKEVS